MHPTRVTLENFCVLRKLLRPYHCSDPSRRASHYCVMRDACEASRITHHGVKFSPSFEGSRVLKLWVNNSFVPKEEARGGLRNKLVGTCFSFIETVPKKGKERRNRFALVPSNNKFALPFVQRKTWSKARTVAFKIQNILVDPKL